MLDHGAFDCYRAPRLEAASRLYLGQNVSVASAALCLLLAFGTKASYDTMHCIAPVLYSQRSCNQALPRLERVSRSCGSVPAASVWNQGKL